MKLPGEAGGNWSERQTKARTYVPRTIAIPVRSIRGRQAGGPPPTTTTYLLYFRGEFLIHSPSLIPDHSSSSVRARAELFHSSCQLRELEANVEPVKLRGSSAAQGEGCTRERVLMCADCATATQPRAHVPVPVPVPDRTSPGETEREEHACARARARTILSPDSSRHRVHTRREPASARVFSAAFWLLTRNSLIELCSPPTRRKRVTRARARAPKIRAGHTSWTSQLGLPRIRETREIQPRYIRMLEFPSVSGFGPRAFLVSMIYNPWRLMKNVRGHLPWIYRERIGSGLKNQCFYSRLK